MRGMNRIGIRGALIAWAVALLPVMTWAAETPRKTNLSEFLSERSSDAKLSVTGEGLRMEGEGRAMTRRPFAVPVRIDVVARTDSTNIRLYYGDRGFVIFNWEVN